MATELQQQKAIDPMDDPRDEPRRHPLVMAAGVAYVLGTALAVALAGQILLSRDVVLLWLMVGLLVLSLNNPGRWVRGMLVDWLPFILFLFAYDFSRQLADGTGWTPHLSPQLRVETFLFGTPIPTVWMQQEFYNPPAAGIQDYAAWVVYLTHFFAPVGLAAILWRFAHPLFKKWRTLVIALSTAGFTTYVLYPAVPPWLAAKQGEISGVHKIKDEMFKHTGTEAIPSAVEKDWVNQVAAMPSLHSAFPVMMMLLFWHRGWKWRIPFLAYSVAMALTLVYTAEHFVVDIIAGWAYAFIIYFAATRWWDWRARRKAEKEGRGDGDEPPPVPEPTAPREPAGVSYTAGGSGAPPAPG